MISVVVPYFTDLMDIFSAVGIFALSVWIPAMMMIMSHHGDASYALVAFNVLLVILGLAGTGLGVWAAMDDIVDKLKHCKVHFVN